MADGMQKDDPLNPNEIAEGKHSITMIAGSVRCLRVDAWELAILAMQSDRFRTDQVYRAAALRIVDRLDDGNLISTIRHGVVRV